MMPHLVELTRVFKGLEMRFLRGDPAMVAEQLKMGEADLAISGPLGQTWERLDSWPIFTEPYRLAVGQNHRLANSKPVSPSELAKERFLCRTYCENQEELTGFLKSHSVAPAVSHKVVNEPDLVALLAGNLGYALAPQSSIQHQNVRMLDLDGLSATRTVSIYAVAGRQRSAAANALIKSLRAADWSAFEMPAEEELKSKLA